MIPRSKEDLQRRHRGLARIAESSVGLMGRTPDYMNVTFAGFAGERRAWLGPEGRNEEGVANLAAFQHQLAREDICLTHTIVHPTVDRVTRPVLRRQPGAAAQGGRHRARHRRARRPHPGHAGAVRRRDRRLPGPPAGRRRHAAEYALSFSIPMDTPGLDLPVPRQRVDARRRPVRPPAVDPLRRAGRLRDLRRRRGAAPPGVHRRRPRRLQLGDGPDGVVAEHHAADHHPGPDEARVRLRPGHAHGRGGQRQLAGHARDARRAARLRRGDPQRAAAGRGARLRPGRGRLVPRRPAAAPDAGDPGHVVPTRARHPRSRSAATTCWPRRAGPCSTTPACGR